MGKAKDLSKDLREKVVELYKTGKGYKKISKELRMLISSVQTLIKKWKMRGSVETKQRSGRPTKISATTARKIVRDAKKNPQIASGEIQGSLRTCGVAVSRCTIRRHLKMGCMVELPEESHYYANATKYPAYNMPNSTETSLKPSGAKSF